jgi:ornithine carbamoyltransferase
MTTLTPTRSFLRVSDLDHDELIALLNRAAAMRHDPAGWRTALDGQTLACYFTKPSTRTRVSFEAAAWRLGMLPVMLRPDELQLGRGEPLPDTARVLSRYAAAIVVRTFAQADLDALAAAASVPVVNALTDDHHPCQALADLLTIRDRFGTLGGLKLAYVGDGNNVAHSLMEAAALAGMHVMVATPGGFGPDPTVTAHAALVARQHRGSIHLTDDPVVAVRGAHAVYTDVWVSMGQDPERDRRLAALAPYQVDADLMASADADAIFLHCLPAHRGEEVTAEVIDGPASAVWDQAANRLPTEQAVLHALITERWS